jgi:multimeric flavodoxin WrbA
VTSETPPPADYSDLRALFINCTLKRSPEQSHTRGLMDVARRIMETQGVATETIRAVDHDIASGVWPDMTEHGWETDEWPTLYQKVRAADILVIGTPIWLGDKSSVAPG